MDAGKPVEPGSGSPWRLASAGTELAGAVLGGCLLGYWIDLQFGTGPWGLIVGAGIGIVGGLYNMIRKAVHESLGVGQGTSKRTDGIEPASREDKSRPPEDSGL
jgi:F0F1-type ATP synthase assembly protein I